MSRRLPPLNSLRAFEAAARNLSFTRAAEEIHVTQAAISHQIKALEDFLNVKLFTRKNRELLLTDEGQMYWPVIRDVFEKLADATERVRAKVAAGPLSVSVVPTFAVQWLVPRLSRFSELHPEIDVRLKASDAEVNFHDDNVDVAIYFGDGSWSDLHVERLLEEFLFPVCSPQLAKGSKPLKTPADLSQHSLLHDESFDGWRRWLNYVGAKSVRWNRGPVFSHTAMVLQAAAHGQGVALAHSVLAQNDLASGRLVRPFDQMLPLEEGYFLVCPRAAADRPKIVAFRQWLQRTIEEDRKLLS
ncbi:transcriptional regulator GcvA [Permianibacter aggregans]|uniref:HTH-type transcriptional regulator TrpI n=1 Tax=Permianibacter aggregans TaxID=1510150 RepID=A0A4V3D879_9GAMM|nr:transcriptional regulator GcvA [Permianibacter aggregans]QGX38878.1 transcriptional regulator GcvA [Permianibacter aggregans]TDQ50687.1 LysR family transcriptional regulator [Permianibacter aggregans]